MTNFRRDCDTNLASSSKDIKFLTKFVGTQKIRKCELEGSKESAVGTVRRPEAVKGAVKHTRLRLG